MRLTKGSVCPKQSWPVWELLGVRAPSVAGQLWEHQGWLHCLAVTVLL